MTERVRIKLLQILQSLDIKGRWTGRMCGDLKDIQLTEAEWCASLELACSQAHLYSQFLQRWKDEKKKTECLELKCKHLAEAVDLAVDNAKADDPDTWRRVEELKTKYSDPPER